MFISTKGYRALDAFQVAPATGAMAAGLAADSEVLQIRWTHATNKCAIQELTVNGMFATTAFAAGAIHLYSTIARAFTAAGTGGGTVTLTDDNQKLQTNHGDSGMGEIRIATTAALGAGTKTLDSEAIGRITTHSSGGAGSATPIIGSIYLPTYSLFDHDVTNHESPIVLSTNEGVIVRATVPITGVWTASFTIKWVELTPFAEV